MRKFLILLLGFVLPVLADDQSDFSSAPDASWQRYDPRAEASLSPTALFDFSVNQCRIVAPPPTTIEEYNAAIGYGRAGLLAPSVFINDAVASVDITAWNPTTINRYLGTSFIDGTFIGVLTRVQAPVSRLAVNGYSASIIDMGPGSSPGGRIGLLQLMLITNEYNYYPLAGPMEFSLEPTHDYRLVLVSRGNKHTARLFDLANPAIPVAEIVGEDPNNSFPNGKTGIMILTDRPALADVTFDNFLAWDGTPPPLVIQPGGDPQTIALSSDLHRSMATRLESTTDLTDPLTSWFLAWPASATQSGINLITVFPLDGPRRFFRRKSLE